MSAIESNTLRDKRITKIKIEQSTSYILLRRFDYIFLNPYQPIKSASELDIKENQEGLRLSKIATN